MLACLPLSWRAKWLAKHGRQNECDELIAKRVKVWATKLLHHIKMDVYIEGEENLPPTDEAVVYAANHQSYLDIPVLLSRLAPPPPLLARTGLDKVPLLAFWMRELGCIFVKRDDVRAAVAALKAAENMVANGKSLVVFPEGTRSKGNAMNAFEPGAVRIACKAGARIVPLAIDGTYKGLEGNGTRIKAAKVRLIILPPIVTDGLTKQQQKELPQKLQEMIGSAKDNKAV